MAAAIPGLTTTLLVGRRRKGKAIICPFVFVLVLSQGNKLFQKSRLADFASISQVTVMSHAHLELEGVMKKTIVDEDEKQQYLLR